MTDRDFEAYASRVRHDHYFHKAALALVAFWAGSVFHWWVGFLVLVGLWLAIAVTNGIILSTTGNLVATRFNRWGWLVGAIVVILVTSAEVVRV